MWGILVAAAFLLLFIFFFLDTKKPNKFPPGPTWLPIIGNYLLFYRLYTKIGYVHLVWDNLSKRYGPLFGIRLGRDRLIIATQHSIVKQILTMEEFDARPDGFFFRFRAFGGRYGLVFVDGEFFNEQKKFVMKHLKNLGFNRSIMQDMISRETTDLVQYLLMNPEKAMKVPEILGVPVLNAQYVILTGNRFQLDDPKGKELVYILNKSFRLTDMSGGILNQLPFLRYIFPNFTCFNQLKEVLNHLNTLIKDLIETHKSSLSPYENRDLIDAFLNEMERRQSEDTTFTDKQLIILLLDLFLAAAETTSSTLSFALLYLVHFPEIQQKLHSEMDSIVGRNEQPMLEHRNRLVYLEAFMQEVARYANVSPTTISHRAKEDTEINGYIIPKDSVVLCNLYNVHMSKDHFGDPEIFRPERFLTQEGKLIQDDWLMPFGLGRRRCIGEAVAKTSVFLFLTALLHNFEIKQKPGSPVPPIKILDGATIVPETFEVVFTPRCQ